MGVLLAEEAPPLGLDAEEGGQRVQALAPSLVPNAYAPDGLLEGVEGRDDSYLLGVQWHPEELVEQAPSARRLFESFIEAAAAHEPEVAAR